MHTLLWENVRIQARGVISKIDLKSGMILARKYEIIQPLGAGWEGEVFLVRRGMHRIPLGDSVYTADPAPD